MRASPEAATRLLHARIPADLERPSFDGILHHFAVLGRADCQHTPTHRHTGSPVLRLSGKAWFGSLPRDFSRLEVSEPEVRFHISMLPTAGLLLP